MMIYDKNVEFLAQNLLIPTMCKIISRLMIYEVLNLKKTGVGFSIFITGIKFQGLESKFGMI